MKRTKQLSNELLLCVAVLVVSPQLQTRAERRTHSSQQTHRRGATAPTADVGEPRLDGHWNQRGYPFATAGVVYEETHGTTTAASITNESHEHQPFYMPSDELLPDIDTTGTSESTEFTGTSVEPIVPQTNDDKDAWQTHQISTTSTETMSPLRTQIVYRYYARQKVRSASSGSIPFMLIGPNVDHWKVTSQQLSARGFNVIAVGPHNEISSTSTDASHSEGPNMVLQLLDSLRWNQVVLVGCDAESTLAIEAALQLAPQRVVGLIMCGKLQQSEKRLLGNLLNRPRTKGMATVPTLELDRWLHTRLRCPFTTIWDGNTELSSQPSFVEENGSSGSGTEHASSTGGPNHLHRGHRTIILGGGTAPHRRRPEIFAWILTRFVEEKIAPPVVDVTTPLMNRHRRRQQARTDETATTGTRHTATRSWSQSWRYPTLPIPWRVNEMFNEESMVVFGRMAATALFYGMTLRVLFYQYDNVRLGFGILSSTRRNVIAVVGSRSAKLWSAVVFVLTIPRRLQRGATHTEKQIVSPVEDEAKSSGTDTDQAPQNITSDQDQPTENEARPFFFLDHVVA